MMARWMNLYRDAKQIRYQYSLFSRGYKVFNKSHVTPEEAYFAMRRLYVLTNGRFNDLMSRYLSMKQRPEKLTAPAGVLGELSDAKLKSIVSELRERGYHIFEQRLDLKLVDEIVGWARQTPVQYLVLSDGGERSGARYSDEMILPDSERPVSPRYLFKSEQIVSMKRLQQLMFDQSLLAVAQAYLGSTPILDLIAMWWSLPFGGKGLFEAAQMYHFDMDRLKFLKFFFYLTDVNRETGPHCYVKGSHRGLPRSLRKDGRFSDHEVESAFGKQVMIELEGPKGTIMAVDTRGLHKGKPLVNGERLIFQIEFANSMFGQNYPSIDRTLILDEHKAAIDEYPMTYGQLFQFH